VADIFISYSQNDRERARLLAALLEAEGYSVWWDASLLGGESFRKTIMTELGTARAAIVVWTENAIQSDWVMSEAGRAHADRKLIPVKTKALTYRDIPPPFDNMHIEDADDREKILAAVAAVLAKPEAAPSALQKVSRRARYELLSWFGIVGAVITLTTNLQSVLTLARWAHQVIESWTSFVAQAWRTVLFFLPAVQVSDAIVLTFALFAIVNMLASLARADGAPSTRGRPGAMRVVSIIAAAAIITVVLYSGLMPAIYEEVRTGGVDLQGLGYYVYGWVSSSIAVSSALRSIGVGGLVVAVGSIVLIVFFIVLPLLPAVVTYLALRAATSFRLSSAALSARLWRVVAGVAVVVALNALSLWIEQQPWATGVGR
jgi:hypothetical protein